MAELGGQLPLDLVTLRAYREDRSWKGQLMGPAEEGLRPAVTWGKQLPQSAFLSGRVEAKAQGAEEGVS